VLTTNTLRLIAEQLYRRVVAALAKAPVLVLQMRRWVIYLPLPMLALLSFDAISQNAAHNIPSINLSSTPLYAAPLVDKPTLVLALSVEWPTVGAQYNLNETINDLRVDDSYSNENEYLGYYDAESCYQYNSTPQPERRRFDRSGAATNRMCDDAFSGNFLNWASSSAIDMLRLALTGGDRLIDEPELTVLQRAVLPDGIHNAKSCMWNSPYFPAKKLRQTRKEKWYVGPAFFGAIPRDMAKAAKNNDIWVANRLDRIYFHAGTFPSGSCSDQRGYDLGKGLLNEDGFFYARVQVCNVDSSGELKDVRDYGFCTRYPNGNFKPTGAAQKYSEQLRMAAFGYLMDHSDSRFGGRYGGVLRAPMKYIGNKTFDVNGHENTPTEGNRNREWDPNTGVFINNPDNDRTYNRSGVINYLNLFGRSGEYKNNDPVGELHYEALRYLQGLPPSADAISNITVEMHDNFPLTTRWSDPYAGRSATSDYSCLKSNIVVIGDVGIHDGDRLPKASDPNNIPDINFWRSVVQSFEKNEILDYTDGQGIVRRTGNPNGMNHSVPSGIYSNQIMGSAYWALTHDIRGRNWTQSPGLQRPGLRVKTLIFDVNQFGLQNDSERRHYDNPLFMAAKYGGFETKPESNNPFNTWGNPFLREDGTPDNRVWSDSENEALSYFRQSDGRSVLSAFDSIFNQASTAERSIAGGAIASKTLTQMGTTIYQSLFDTSDWSGDLLAFPVNVSGKNDVTVATSANWSASARLSALPSPANSRNIVVGNTGPTANPVAAPFTWASPEGRSGIEATLRTALDTPPPNASTNNQLQVSRNRFRGSRTRTTRTDGLGQARLNYLRGDRSNEGTLFRTRQKLLGDIINSGVAYSGPPTSSIPSSSFQAFFNANAARTPAVFVGANDGMLHAFNATTGDELFAYIPSWLGPKLPALTSTAYASSHQSYVDATPVVAEAQTGSTGTAADWKTVLVSGTGAGGRGIFALDVTRPERFSAANVMWEFTQADDPDMGHVIGKPQILKFRTSAPGAGTLTYKWFAVVGSGVNNHVHDRKALRSDSGKPALFLLDISKPLTTPWTRGQNYHKISLPVDDVLSAQKATGLVDFSAALGFSREVTQIYMGDLHGNLWKLDFLEHGSDDWNINALSAFNKGLPSQPIPFFIAKDASGNPQPITMAPKIVYGPTPLSSYILFGTGKFMENSDIQSTTPQSFYMLYDNGTAIADTSPPGASAISGRDRLREGRATTARASSPGKISVPAYSLGRATLDNDPFQRSGWYFDFPTPGERTLGEATVFGKQIIFSTLIPDIAGHSGDCSATIGGGAQYSLEITDGSGASRISNVGLMGAPLIAELSSATTTSKSDNAGRRIRTITGQIIQQGSSGLSPDSKTTRTVITGRLSWRQINNYQDLKNAP
jgi:type IV pilus assembly protein PilY1